MIAEVLHTPWGTAKINLEGYYHITSRKEGYCTKKLHRLIYEKFYDVELPSEVHIHHKDGNKLNNCILNLEAMLNKEHNSQHMLGENNPMFGKKHPLSVKINISKSRNSLNLFRVSTKPCKKCKQGFTYVYSYYDENNKRISIVSTELSKLKKKVLSKGLEWIEFDNQGVGHV